MTINISNIENKSLDIENLTFKSKSRKEEAYDAIKKLIINNKIKPDTLLVERHLAEMLNLSRTTIRMALIQLCNENLVTNYPGRGMAVSGISLEDAVEVFEIREVLDVLAMKLFLKKQDKQKLDEMRECIAKMKQTLDDEDYQKFSKYDIKFHNCYLENCNNKRLQNMLSALHDQIIRFTNYTSNDEGRCKESYIEHKSIIDAINEGDYQKAQDMVYQHISNSRQYHIDRLTRR